MRTIACSEGNFRAGRDGKKIEYIVVHYTAGQGDTAYNNALYFSRTNVTASAHFFVDENEAIRSVQDGDTAWHCGATKYLHPKCKNHNSLGVELCSRKDPDGRYYFMAATVDNAVSLVRELIQKYGIPIENVLRHYDVTGKKCPAPFVDDAKAWTAFKARLARKEDSMSSYQEFKEFMARYEAEKAGLLPAEWSKEAREWAEGQEIIQGGPTGSRRYKSYITREEAAEMQYRASLK